MGTNFGILCHDTYTEYLSRHVTSNVTDTLFYGDNTTLLDKKKSLRMCTYNLGGSVGRATALKAGGCGFRTHLNSLFSMKIQKRALRFVSLPCRLNLSSHATSKAN